MVVVLVQVRVLLEVLVRGRGNGRGSRSRRRGRSRTGTEAAENDANVIAVTYVYKRHSSTRAALDGGNHAPPYIMNPDSDEIIVLSRYRVVQNLLIHRGNATELNAPPDYHGTPIKALQKLLSFSKENYIRQFRKL